jgi:hypothetical protein
MDSFNKVISFVLGLVVVIVFFAVVSGRLKIGNFSPSFAKKTVSPTPTPISTVTIDQEQKTVVKTQTKNTTSYNSYQTTQTKKIPATGLPTLFIPSLLASGFGGYFLKKTGKKD